MVETRLGKIVVGEKEKKHDRCMIHECVGETVPPKFVNVDSDCPEKEIACPAHVRRERKGTRVERSGICTEQEEEEGDIEFEWWRKKTPKMKDTPENVHPARPELSSELREKKEPPDIGEAAARV